MTNKSIIGNQRTREYKVGNMDELLARAESYVEPPEVKPKKENNLENKTNQVNPIKLPSTFNPSDYILVPSNGLYFSKNRLYLGKNWFETHKKLQSNNQRMPTIPEFLEFLKYTKTNFPDIYNEITEVRDPWRGCWTDADFKVKDDKLYINSNHILDKNGNLTPQNSELLDKNTLMLDKTPGISLDDYLTKNHTTQGLPNKSVKQGDFYYWYPRSDNNSVARFSAGSGGAGLSCNWIPSNGNPSLGVFAVAQEGSQDSLTPVEQGGRK